ncbi:granulocyte colony-stimulating factor receptor isoform X2 [Excalfactoria chinensis]|uniref:granulocyte colony-stimulating factor receptor isoform X2 n=1 Tax=Excalfactoria chinensis TaxID=46218 RepID=UPI003B3B1C59
MARRGAGTPLLLWLSLLLLLSLSGTQQRGAELDCASVAVDSPVVPMGSAITASCTIRREHCRGLEDGQPRISWLLDNEPMAGRQRRGVGGTEVSELRVPQLNHPQAKLWCCVEWNGTKQRVGMAEIRAGYPPGKPSNLSCLLDLGDYGLTCRWQQGADGHLPTNVMLKCAMSRSPAVTCCTPQNGRSQCTVPRRLLQLYRPMELWVTASNVLGTAESERLRIDPMDVAKLDPPTLQSVHSVPPQTNCVTLTWALAPRSAHMELCCELRYRAAVDPSWDVVTGIAGHAGTVQHCKFLFGMLYHFQMRCRRDSARGYWSEWSLGRNYTTHEKAPEGKLDAWWSTQQAMGRMEVQLRWKAPRPQEANGRVLGYRVTLGSRRRGKEPQTVCNTTDTQCDFTVPVRTGRVYLSAYNAAGESSATEIVLLERKDSIEPFQQYNISVYALYKDVVGTPAHVAAYSKQKAPSHAPKLHLKSIGKSQAELSWEPVAVELQNGFITHYTVFWANSTAEVSSAVVNSSLSSFTIHGLKPSTLYKVHIMASTAGGSTNGTSLTLVTTVLDDMEIQFLFLTLGLVFVLLIILLICFQKNGRVKKQFWPNVPDPANSSLGTWVPAEQEPLQTPGVKEPGLTTISTVTVLDKAVGKQAPTQGKEPPAEPPAPAQPYMQQHRPSTLQANAGLGAEPVQYVQVVGGSSQGPQHVAPCLYLRSSSTQPLLSDPSPEPYENFWFRGGGPSCARGSLEEPLLDFPLLRGLQVSGAEELHDFQPC